MAINFTDAPAEGAVFKAGTSIQSNFVYRSGKWTRAEGWVLIQSRGVEASGANSYYWTLPTQYQQFNLTVYGFTPNDGTTGVSWLQLSYDPSGAPLVASGCSWGGFYAYSGGHGHYVNTVDNGCLQTGGGQDGAHAYYAVSQLIIDIWPGDAAALPVVMWNNNAQHNTNGAMQYLVGGGYGPSAARIQCICLHMQGPVCRFRGANLWGYL